MTLLRSILFNLFFFAGSFVMVLYGTVLRFTAPPRVLPTAINWARLMLWGARVICGIRWRVVGTLPQGPALIAAHHESAFDPLVWLILLRHPTVVMKQELQRIPLFGPLTCVAGMIVVDRRGASKTMRGLVRDAQRAAAEGRQIVIFPEGTRAAPGSVLPLQPGIAAMATGTGLSVIPVTTDSGRYWGRRAFRKRAGTISIVLRAPIAAGTPRRQLVEQLQAALHCDPQVVDNSVH